MNLMQLFAFGFCFLRTLRIVAWHFLPYSSDVFAHELCVFMIYVCTQVVLEPSNPLSLFPHSIPVVYATHSVCLPRGKCNAAWLRPGLVRLCLGFALVTCCALVGFLLVHCPAARQPRTLLLMTFVLCKPRTFESNLSLADEVVTVFRDFAILDCDFDLI